MRAVKHPRLGKLRVGEDLYSPEKERDHGQETVETLELGVPGGRDAPADGVPGPRGEDSGR